MLNFHRNSIGTSSKYISTTWANFFRFVAPIVATFSIIIPSVSRAVDTPIDSSTVSTIGGNVLTVFENAVVPVLVSTMIVVGALIGLYFILRFLKREVPKQTSTYHAHSYYNDDYGRHEID